MNRDCMNLDVEDTSPVNEETACRQVARNGVLHKGDMPTTPLIQSGKFIAITMWEHTCMPYHATHWSLRAYAPEIELLHNT